VEWRLQVSSQERNETERFFRNWVLNFDTAGTQ
jgi:hypothetical protein